MPLNCWTRRRSWSFRWAMRSSRESFSADISFARWIEGTWKKSVNTGSTTTAQFVRFVATLSLSIDNGACLIPVILLLPFSHVVAKTIAGEASAAGCDDDDDTVMEWWVVVVVVVDLLLQLLTKLKNFGEVLVTSPFFFVVECFWLGLWCPFNETFSDEAIDGSCWRNCRL